MREINLAGVRIADDTDPYVIAEIGHNHQGSVDTCIKLFQGAARCGVNAVKLQKRTNRELFTREMYDKPYNSENSYGETYGKHREALEFDREQFRTVKSEADRLGLVTFATPFDFRAVDFLVEVIEAPFFKMASADITNIPLLRYVARVGRPMLISTGGADMDDVVRAHDAIMELNPELAILQCTAAYPTQAEDMHLRVITTFRERFPEVVIGLSDHFSGISMCSVAYTLGARIFEKHFTLNRAWRGTDQAFSLAPSGMERLVRDLKRVRVALGDAEKRRHEVERAPIRKMGKMLVAARELPIGHVVTEEDVAIKSPADGLPPYEFDRLLGLRLTKAMTPDQPFCLEHLTSAG